MRTALFQIATADSYSSLWLSSRSCLSIFVFGYSFLGTGRFRRYAEDVPCSISFILFCLKFAIKRQVIILIQIDYTLNFIFKKRYPL